MKRFTPILILISLLMTLFFVSTITVLSSYGLPHKKADCKILHIKSNEQNYAMWNDTGHDE